MGNYSAHINTVHFWHKITMQRTLEQPTTATRTYSNTTHGPMQHWKRSARIQSETTLWTSSHIFLSKTRHPLNSQSERSGTFNSLSKDLIHTSLKVLVHYQTLTNTYVYRKSIPFFTFHSQGKRFTEVSTQLWKVYRNISRVSLSIITYSKHPHHKSFNWYRSQVPRT